MHYHQAYWSIQAPLSCFLSLRLFFTLCALGQYGPAGQVVQILSWMSMRHTYLIVANWSALQRLTSLHPWANTLWSALRKSAWPHHWVLTHVSMVLWHACQPCHDSKGGSGNVWCPIANGGIPTMVGIGHMGAYAPRPIPIPALPIAANLAGFLYPLGNTRHMSSWIPTVLEPGWGTHTSTGLAVLMEQPRCSWNQSTMYTTLTQHSMIATTISPHPNHTCRVWAHYTLIYSNTTRWLLLCLRYMCGCWTWAWIGVSECWNRLGSCSLGRL